MSLAASRSPFLKHGATQPVKWMAWGDAAFERARAENRPILLDIGAVWCHWCHVMDRESYENPETAALINERFVPVKVDRDERPDVDARYQRAVQTLTGHGGWPLTAFLTPDGDVYYGGTYFPPEDGYGRPSFRRVLHEVARIWYEEPDRVRDAVRGIRDRLSAYARAETEAGQVTPEFVSHAIEEFAGEFDFRFGGFGSAPKFPNPGGLALILDYALDTGTTWAQRMLRETLDAMARGGIYDQVGGGFHRYSVDARWIIPHFEKMSYDNGPLLDVYARAAAACDSSRYRRIASDIVAHYFDIAPDLLAAGKFPASQDADVGPDDDGSYWTWTHDEVAATLRDDVLTSIAVQYYGLNDPAGSMHLDPARHVLFQALPTKTLADRLQTSESELRAQLREIRHRLKLARDRRPRPFIDDSQYSGWNALLVSGFLAAARYADTARAADVAVSALDRIWQGAFREGVGVVHRVDDADSGVLLEDQAYVAQALVDAFEFTQREVYLDRCRQVLDIVRRRFAAESGAFADRPFDSPAPVAGLREPQFPIADAPTPSANGVMAMVLLRAAALLHDDELRAASLGALNAFGATARRMGAGAATFMRAVSWATEPVTTVVIVDDDEIGRDALFRTALRTYRPRTVVRRFSPANLTADVLPPELRAMVSAEAPRAYVCVGNACRQPVRSAAELQAILSE